MAAFDRKDRAYYDKFTDEQKKKFSTYLMLKYGANVGSNEDLQAYYLMATNERVNKSQKFLAKLYPNMKSDEIDLLAKINDKRDLRDLARELGHDDKSIKSDL